MILKKYSIQYRVFLICDYAAILCSYLIAAFLRYGEHLTGFDLSLYAISFVVIICAYGFMSISMQMYSDVFMRGYLTELIGITKVNASLFVVLVITWFVTQKSGLYSRSFLAYFLLANVCMTFCMRRLVRHVLLVRYKQSSGSVKVMLVTSKERVHKVLKEIRRQQEWMFRVTSIAIVDENMVNQEIEGIPVVAHKDNLYENAKTRVVDEVFIHLPNTKDAELKHMILAFENMGIVVNLNINAYDLDLNAKTIGKYGEFAVITYSTKLFNPWSAWMKRAIDVLGALVGMGITLLVSLIIAPAILIETPGPLLFAQERIGKNGRRFKIYKFRSMYQDAEERKLTLMVANEMSSGLMFKMENDPRITKVGNFIRKTSIDELPQFFNVLKGDMSLVGTRPPTVDEFAQYQARHKRRLSLKPGITGLWQVSGRSNITDFEEVVKLDLQYIDKWSLWMDFKILLKTIYVVLARVGSR